MTNTLVYYKNPLFMDNFFIPLGPGVIFEGKAWNIPLSGASERLRPCRQTLDQARKRVKDKYSRILGPIVSYSRKKFLLHWPVVLCNF